MRSPFAALIRHVRRLTLIEEADSLPHRSPVLTSGVADPRDLMILVYQSSKERISISLDRTVSGIALRIDIEDMARS